MVPQKKMTRLIQIGLSHSEKARTLASKGYLMPALEELEKALEAFNEQNQDGMWDDSIAGVLNNIGLVNLSLNRYDEAASAFTASLNLKKRLSNDSYLISTLIGLSDTYRCQGKFGAAMEALENALDISARLKNDALTICIYQRMDMLDRCKNDLPDISSNKGDIGELYIPSAARDIYAVVRRIDMDIDQSNSINIDIVLGFPELIKDLDEIRTYPIPDKRYPCIATLLPNMVIKETDISVNDEEENAVSTSVMPFEGYIFAPDSYNLHGLLPIPHGKEYQFTGGRGIIVTWKVAANGWYNIKAKIKVRSIKKKFRMVMVFPYGDVKISSLSVKGQNDKFRKLCVEAGTFYNTHDARELKQSGDGIIFSRELNIFNGELSRSLNIVPQKHLRYAILDFNLI